MSSGDVQPQQINASFVSPATTFLRIIIIIIILGIVSPQQGTLLGSFPVEVSLAGEYKPFSAFTNRKYKSALRK